MSACLLQMFVNKLNNYEPELARRFIIPEVQEHLDRVEQDKQEYIMQKKYLELNMLLNQACQEGNRCSATMEDLIRCETQILRLVDMLSQVEEDMFIMNVAYPEIPLEAFLERYPSDKYDKYDVWEGDYPPRYFEYMAKQGNA